MRRYPNGVSICVLVTALVGGANAAAQTITWDGPTRGSQNLATAPTLPFAKPGTYTLTVDTGVVVTFMGAAAGGGGSSGHSALTTYNGGWDAQHGGGGGGGGAVTSGTTLQLVAGKTYSLIVGAGGAGGARAFSSGWYAVNAGAAGGSTTFVNATDAITLVSLAGGKGGFETNGTGGGAGGRVIVGSNGISGGSGGWGAPAFGSTKVPGGAGGAATNGAGGGGGGGAGDNDSGAMSGGGRGGAGSQPGGNPGAGGNNNGLAGDGGGAPNWGGTGGGGGGGASFAGVSGAFGGGGGGGGGVGTGPETSLADGLSGRGGTGQNGAAVFVYGAGQNDVAPQPAPCAYTVAPTTIASPAAGGSGTVAVNAGSCTWTATSGATWLTIISGASGTGTGALAYQVAANFTGAARTATLTVSGQAIAVSQAAIDHVVITASTPTLLFRGSKTLTATAYDSANHVIPNVAFTWSSSDTGVIRLNETSPNTTAITAVGMNQSGTTIIAKPANGPSGSIQVVVDPGSVLVFDSFVGPTGTPIAQHQPMINQANGAWRVTGSPGVSIGNGAHPSGPGGDKETATIEAGAADVSIAADWLPASTDNAFGGIVFRRSDASNYWVACYYGTKLALVRYTAGVPLVIKEDEVGPRQQRHLEVEVWSNVINVWSDGVLVLQVFDAFNLTATEHGLQWWNYGDPWSTLTNFEVDGTLLPVVTSISLDGPTSAIVDRATTLTATLRDAAGAPVTGSYVRWPKPDAAGLSLTPVTALTATLVSSEIGTFTVTAKAPRGPAAGAAATITVTPCVDPLTVDNMSVPTEGGARSLVVTAPGDCTWKLRNASEWIAVSGETTTGPRSLSFTIEANGYPWPRSGGIVIGGRRLTITQAGRSCSIGIWPGSGHWAGDGGSGGFDIVATPPECGWWITTGAPWIHLNNLSGSGVGGNGSATVTFVVDPNPTASTRSAVIDGSGISYPITQDAAGTTGGGGSGGSGGGGSTPVNCQIALSPGYVSFGSGGGTRSLSIAAGSGCASSIGAGAFSDWIDFDFRSGSGSWQTNYFVHANTSDRPRTALVQVGDAVLRIDQNAAGDNPFFRKILQENGVPTNVPQAGEDCTMQCTGSNPISCTVTCTPPVISLPLPPIMPWPDPPGGGDPPCDITRFRVDANGTPSCDPIPGGGEEPPPPLSPGIFLKVHWISVTNYLHASIRIVLSEEDLNQLSQWKPLFRFDLGSGFWVATIGADGSTFCGGLLKSDVDRPQDMYYAPAMPPEHLSYSPSEELALVDTLFRLDRSYGDNLLYACFPTPENQYYNSNSFAAGLLLAAGVPLPMTPQVNLSKFPGWAKPVPSWLFFTR